MAAKTKLIFILLVHFKIEGDVCFYEIDVKVGDFEIFMIIFQLMRGSFCLILANSGQRVRAVQSVSDSRTAVLTDESSLVL